MLRVFKLIIILVIIISLKENIFSNKQKNSIPEYIEFLEEKKVIQNYLKIDDINFSKPFYFKESKYNNIDYGLELLDSSKYPNEEGIVIIAAHSGSSSVAIFNNLKKLIIGSKATIVYQEKEYNYRLLKKEEHVKTGSLSLEIKSIDLILITCIKKNKQLVLYYTLE